MFINTFNTMAGSGTAENPYEITNIAQLQSMSEDLSATYELGCDIDASETSDWNDGKGFKPIGNIEDDSHKGDIDYELYNPFTGTLLGNNYTIKNLYINRPDEHNIGLFGAIDSDGSVKELNLSESRIKGNFAVGGVVGYNKQGDITSTVVSDVVVKGENLVGGFAGFNNRDCMVMDVKCSDTYLFANGTVGRIVGENLGYIINYEYSNCGSVGEADVGEICGCNSGKIVLD